MLLLLLLLQSCGRMTVTSGTARTRWAVAWPPTRTRLSATRPSSTSCTSSSAAPPLPPRQTWCPPAYRTTSSQRARSTGTKVLQAVCDVLPPPPPPAHPHAPSSSSLCRVWCVDDVSIVPFCFVMVVYRLLMLFSLSIWCKCLIFIIIYVIILFTVIFEQKLKKKREWQSKQNHKN